MKSLESIFFCSVNATDVRDSTGVDVAGGVETTPETPAAVTGRPLVIMAHCFVMLATSR